MKDSFFSIIIPTLNEEENLKILLEALADQIDKDFEIIVCDSQSKDKTQLVFNQYKDKFFKAYFYQKKFKNVAEARNFGASQARGKFLIFFDADVEPAKDFVAEIKKKIFENRLHLLTVWNRPKKTSNINGKIILFLLNISMTFFQKIKPAANGPVIIINHELFKKIKGFDEAIIFGEDFDLVQRAVNNRGKFSVFTKPIIYVSTRRFEKEGLFLSLYKSIKAIIYQLFFGPIKKPIFDYQMGGSYYKNNNKRL